MYTLDELPVPDWGLTCPGCGQPLAGSKTQRCEHCSQLFDVRRLLARQRPIPDLGLVCPECEYRLTGLTETRCPECGNSFDLESLLDEADVWVDHVMSFMEEGLNDAGEHYLKRREPNFTGLERPLPDFGLFCDGCNESLAGAPANVCPHCGMAFDLSLLAGRQNWVSVEPFILSQVSWAAPSILYDACVPYLVGNEPRHAADTGRGAVGPRQICVPGEFFFDALYYLTQAAHPSAPWTREAWICGCGETVPAGFEICWSCGASHPLFHEAHEREGGNA